MTSLARMPWQDRITEAGERIEKVGGACFTKKGCAELDARKKQIFSMAQIPGTIAMVEGGGAAPLNILIQTENGWLVRVVLSGGEAHALADLLVTSVRKN